MQRILLAAVMGLGVSSFSMVAPAGAAESVATPFVVAQDVDFRLGPGGVRIRGEGDRDRDRERRRFRERDRDDDVRIVRRGHRDEGCRTVIIRRETPNGSVTRRIRRCG